jgi:putative ATP-binding cassette transporter
MAMLDRPTTFDAQSPLLRFWRSAGQFWLDGSNRWALLLGMLLVGTVVLQLVVQYRINFWSRDFFNAIGRHDAVLLRRQALHFAPLAAASLTIAVASIWGRMTLEREWRRWLSRHLYDYWLSDGSYRQLECMAGDHQTPEYRIADDARVATELPVDLVLGLLSSLITAGAFIGVLYRTGGSLDLTALGFSVVVPGYLVLSVLLYSLVVTSTTLLIGHGLARVIEQSKAAEAHLRATGARLRAEGEAGPREHHSGIHRSIDIALDRVITNWRALCWQLMRMTVVTQMNVLVAPSIGALLCAPKYLGGSMLLGDVVQAAAAFVVVQGAFSWLSNNYGRLAEWASSAKRVASLLQSLDRLQNGPRSQQLVVPARVGSRQVTFRAVNEASNNPGD